MPEQDSQFPSSITLSGADYFCWQLDGLMRRTSGKHNVCTFVVTLPERLALADLQRQLANRPAYQWLCRLRLKLGLPFTLAKWILDAQAELPTINEYQLPRADTPLDSWLSTDLDIQTQSAFKIALLQCAGAGSILVFSWHHVLMDAHGGEAFIRYLGTPHTQPEWVADAGLPLPLRTRANIALAVKQFLYDVSGLPLLSLYQKRKVKPLPRYRIMSFTPAQCQSINTRAQQLGAGFLVSAFYLAAIATAVAHVQQQRGMATGDILAPVPLDRRKRGATGPVLGNQVSFLFYRLPNAVLGDVQACTTEVIQQIKTLMRSENPGQYVIMMDFLRRIPGFIYRSLLQSPTEGLMASFFYSDTGESLQDFDTLFGQPVSHAVHYPPNMYPPGLTFVFSRFQGKLQLTLGYMEADLNAAEVELLLLHLSQTLLGDG